MKKLILIFLVSTTVFSCTSKKQEEINEEAGPVCIDSISSSCPFFTTDIKGNIVLSWVKGINDSTYIMCYSVSSDNGKTFTKAIEIPSSINVHPHGENMPKIIFKPNGEIIAVWGASNANPKNKYSGLVFYAQSFDDGNTWTAAKLLVTDTNSYDQRYFDVALLGNGEAGILWLDNRKKNETEGSTVYFASTNGKNGFENEKAICESICQCCRTDLFIDSKNNIHAAFRDIINDSIRDMVHMISSDGGKVFSVPQRISGDNWVINGCPHTGPAMAENKNGLHFVWYTMGGGQGVFYCNSPDDGKSFSKRDSVSTKASAKHPQIIANYNGDIIIVWDETVKKGEDFNTRIGMQHRNAKGERVSAGYITPDSINCSFPVIKALGNEDVIIAYTQKIGKFERLYYQTIGL